MEVGIKKLKQEAVLPKYATDGSGCFDFFCIEDFNIGPRYSYTVSTGLAFEIPKDHVMLLFSRSGHGFKDDLRLANCVGVIDSDYRGELKIKVTSDSNHKWRYFKRGDRIAQGMVIKFDKVVFKELEELSETDRGEGGFGSTDRTTL